MYSDTAKAVNKLSPGKTFQRLSINFDFVGNGTSPSSTGLVKFKLIVAGRTYGPYRSLITCSKAAWEARRQLKVPIRGQVVQRQVLALQGRLLEGFANLDAFGDPISGEMILEQAKLVVTVGAGGSLYVH